MKREEVIELIKRFKGVEKISDVQVANELGMTKGNFFFYRDPLTDIQVRTVKAWCFDHYDEVADFIPAHWRLDDAA